MQVEHPPSAIHELGRGNSHQGSRGHVTDPVPIVVDSRPPDAGGQGIQSHAGPRPPDVVGECCRESKCHGGVTGRHRILTGKRNEAIDVQTFTGTRSAKSQFPQGCSSARKQQRGGQSGTGASHLIMSAYQADPEESQSHGAIKFRLSDMTYRSGNIISARTAVVLGKALNRVVQQHKP